jgi:aryl-alcohol dehydrogenase-like predicted oxidoreductase
MATHAHPELFRPLNYRRLGRTQFFLSPLGFGARRLGQEQKRGSTYPGIEPRPTQRELLEIALKSGINWIDTSSCYPLGDASGLSEIQVGEILTQITSQGATKALSGSTHANESAPIVVITKAGISDTTGSQIDISPRALKLSLERSRDHLRQATLQVLLLQDVDHLLQQAVAPLEYYQMLDEALTFLESEVQSGRLMKYGLSCRGLSEPRESQTFTSLEALVDLAQERGLQNFAVLEFPLNLLEPGALLEPHTARGEPLIDFASRNHFGLLAHRAWNVLPSDRLAAPVLPSSVNFKPVAPEHNLPRLQEALEQLLVLESQLFERNPTLSRRFAHFGHTLSNNRKTLWNWLKFNGYLNQRILPGLQALREELKATPLLGHWLQSYESKLNEVLSLMTQALYEQTAEVALQRAALLDHLTPELQSTPSLADKALRSVLSVPPLSGIAVGVSTHQQLEAALQAAQAPLLQSRTSPDLFDTFNQLMIAAPQDLPSSPSSH